MVNEDCGAEPKGRQAGRGGRLQFEPLPQQALGASFDPPVPARKQLSVSLGADRDLCMELACVCLLCTL